MRKVLGILLGLLIIGAVVYIQAAPIGGANVYLLDEAGNPLTDHGKVYYTIWTFDRNSSIKILQKGTLTRNLFKRCVG
ncbi:hypothetical protein [Thermococcus sp.]